MDSRIFFTCHETDNTVHADHPIAVEHACVSRIARQVLRGEGDFIGIVDDHDVTLQLRREGGGIWIEVPVPAERGSYGREIALADLEAVLAAITPPFDPAAIEGLRFVAW